MQEPEGPPEPSRRRPPRAPTPDAIPIPEAATTRPRSSGVQDVLAAHQRAVDARIEEGLREIRMAVADAVGRPMEPEPEEPLVERPPTDDIVRGLVTHTEERFQALSLRLRRIEDVLRSISKREGPEVEHHLEALRRSVTSIAATQQQEFARLTDFQRALAQRIGTTQRAVAEALVRQQRRAAKALADQQAEAIADLGVRIGRGIAAIARQMQTDLQARQDALLERYLRGLAGELRRHQERRARPPAPTRAPRPEARPPGPGPQASAPETASRPPRPSATPPERPASRTEPAPEAPPEPPASPPAPSAPESAAVGDEKGSGAERVETPPEHASEEPSEASSEETRPKPPPRQYLIERKHPAPPSEPAPGGS